MRGSAVLSSGVSAPDTSGSCCSETLLRRELVGGGRACLSLPCEEVSERALLDVALLRLNNLDRAFCSRVLILLMPATSRRRPACSLEMRCEAVVVRALGK